MENFKFVIFSIIIIAVIVLGGYWAVFSLEPGSIHANREKLEKLEGENLALEKEIKTLKNELATIKASQEEKVEEPVKSPEAAPVTTLKYQSLINELQKLADDKIFMKEKSKGSRVGTVQNFLNLYFNTKKRVDNDYGATTKADVIKFQKAVGLTADGETGPATYLKMIEWLKKQ